MKARGGTDDPVYAYLGRLADSEGGAELGRLHTREATIAPHRGAHSTRQGWRVAHVEVAAAGIGAGNLLGRCRPHGGGAVGGKSGSSSGRATAPRAAAARVGADAPRPGRSRRRSVD